MELVDKVLYRSLFCAMNVSVSGAGCRFDALVKDDITTPIAPEDYRLLIFDRQTGGETFVLGIIAP